MKVQILTPKQIWLYLLVQDAKYRSKGHLSMVCAIHFKGLSKYPGLERVSAN